MEMPNIKNQINDGETGVTYIVMAYRRLTYEELVQAVRVFHAGRKSKKRLKKGVVITIFSLIGAD